MVIVSIAQGPVGGPAGQAVLVLAGTAGVVLIAAIGAWLAWRRPSPRPRRVPAAGVLAGLRRARGAAVQEWSPALAATVALLAGLAAAVVVTYLFGRLTLSGPIVRLDHSIASFAAQHRVPSMSHLMLTATLLGSYPVISAVVVTGGVAIGVFSGRWAPLVILAVAEVAEKEIQRAIGLAIHTVKPPHSSAIGAVGGYFSGGSARVVLIFGLFAYFLHWAGARGRRSTLLWTFVALAGFIEGYSRLYIGRHWVADIVGGWLFGGLALAAFAFAAGALRGGGEPLATGPGAADMAAGASGPPAAIPAPRQDSRGRHAYAEAGGNRTRTDDSRISLSGAGRRRARRRAGP
jgi:membrane-associated phospholipid phosphatase